MFRSSPSEVFSNKDTAQIRSEPTGGKIRRSAIPTKLPCDVIEITLIHECPPRIHTIPAKHLSPEKHLWETAPVCQNSFKRFKL